MKVSLLIIASEILEAKIQDLNTHTLAKLLKSHNHTLNRVLIVADQENHILKALTELSDSDLIVTSGGMGPTPDDLTKSCLAHHFQSVLEKNSLSVEVVKKNYENFGRTVADDHGYMHIPKDSTPLFNPQGFAPGLLFKNNKLTLLALAGVPREFKSMLELYLPNILSRPANHIFDFIIRTRGIGEEKIFNSLDNTLWTKLSEFGALASLPHLYGVDLTVRLQGKTLDELRQKQSAINTFINNHPIKDYVWHIGEESLEECIINKARSLHLHFAFAESATAGLCSSRITDINGSSQVFYGSVICYHSDIKTNLLGVKSTTINQHDVVSEEVAREMAVGLRQLYPVDVAIGITGYAGPHSKEEEIPVGTVCIGVSSPLGTSASKFQFRGDRLRLKDYFAQIALFQLLETLEKLSPTLPRT